MRKRPLVALHRSLGKLALLIQNGRLKKNGKA